MSRGFWSQYRINRGTKIKIDPRVTSEARTMIFSKWILGNKKRTTDKN